MGNVIIIIIIILNGCSVRLLTIEVKLKLRELLSMLSPCLTIVDNFLENKIKNIFSEKDSRKQVSNFNKTGLTDRVVWWLVA